MQQAAVKNYFQLNKGLNTESNEINFPDGFTVDEANYELLVDGSRRRRKALDQESGGSDLTVSTMSGVERVRAYKWRNVGGNPSLHYIVTQVGSILHFAPDQETPSSGWLTPTIDLEELAAPNATQGNIESTPISFSTHRGFLLIASRYIEPSYIEWDATNSVFIATKITLKMRDFFGVDDGVPITTQPSGTITDSHLYNLLNRGWKNADITDYKTNSSNTTNPAKNMIWWKGYKRTYDGSTAAALINPDDGVHSWDTSKMEAERVGGGDAPQGSMVLDVFNTLNARASSAGAGSYIPITNWSHSGSGTWTVTVTAVAHGLSNGSQVTIEGNRGIWRKSSIFVYYVFSLDGTYTVDNVTTDTFDIEVTQPAGFVAWINQYNAYGVVLVSATVTNPDGVEYDERPTAVEGHDGHIFWAGVPNSEYADHIFFSQLGIRTQTFERCYQEADPTDPDINELVSTDGGVIIIPNVGTVKDMLSTRQGLLVFSDQGVWEIGNGRRGAFTADGYAIRKVTDTECSSPYSPLKAETFVIYTGPKGISAISPNQYTGLLEEQNISDALIKTLWNSIEAAEQAEIQTIYDDASKRIYFLYDEGTATNANQYNRMLVFDIRLGAFTKYHFGTSSTVGIVGAVAITDADSTSVNKKFKALVHTSATVLEVCDFEQTDYTDFTGSAMPTPYMYTGWDNIGDFQRRKQAPIITVYQKRTETGYTSTGNGWEGDNESSTTMTARWDWSDDSVTGKVGAAQQIYRHVRDFVPSAADDVNGYPVVVTRNKVRGRGRVLQLYFEANSSTKDSHILGFTTNYKVSRRV